MSTQNVPALGRDLAGPDSKVWQRWGLSFVGALPVMLTTQLLTGLDSRTGANWTQFLIDVPIFVFVIMLFAVPAAVFAALLVAPVEWALAPRRTAPWAVYALAAAIGAALWVHLIGTDITTAQGAVVGAGGVLAGAQLAGPLGSRWGRVLTMLVVAVAVAIIGLAVGVPGPDNPFR